MRRGKNVFWGVLFLVGAVALLVRKLGLLNGIGFWSILFSIGLAGVFIDGIVKRSWGRMLFALAFLAIVNGDMPGIERLVPWTVLGMAALGTIGLNMLFPLKHRHGDSGHMVWNDGIGEDSYNVAVDEEGGEDVKSEVSFGSSVKYIQSSCLRTARLESSFGTLTVYFDNAILMNHRAQIRMDVSFGSMELYVPADWHVVFNVSSDFGSVKEHGYENPDGENVLTINGDVSFGALEVYYI